MATFERTVTVQAFHYIPADALDLSNAGTLAYVQWDRLRREIPDFDIYDVTVAAEEVTDLFEDEEGAPLLTIVQRWYVDGERSNIAHVLRPEDWLVQDFTAEGNYRVLNPAELHRFLKGTL
jgi:hypothetical protein